jgi:hypothetical protein
VTWYAFQGLNGGQAIDLAGSQEKQATIEGFHGYATQAQAQANPNSVNFLTKVQADAFIADYHAAVAEQAQPGGANANILNPVTAVKAGTTGVITELENATGVNAIGDFFKLLADKNLWIRAAKILVGGVLVIVGLAHMTGADNAVASAARKVPLPI